MIELELEHGRVLFTGRRGGVSAPPFDSLNLGILTGDDPAAIARNREHVRAAADVGQLRWNIQVHGTRVTDTADRDEPVDADAITTTERDIGVLVLAADCLPIAISGEGRVAMVHGGWRGLAGGIVGEAAGYFTAGFDAAIGPGICQKHYEVSHEVLAEFARWPDAASGRNLDLKRIARLQLEAAGARSVSDVERCTYCEPDDFFSHRRDGAVTGRQAGVAWLK